MSKGDPGNDGGSTAPTVQATPSGEEGVDEAAADTAVAGDAGSDQSAPRSAEATDPDSLIGDVLQERYEITSKIGQGGMGAVYEARHSLIGKRVAVKVLLDKYASRDQIVARLKQEAKLASSIGHPNIIDITDFGVTHDGRTFVVMEFLEGQSLGACIGSSGPMEPMRAIHITRQIASALGAAHQKGIIHRDIKPENIFLLSRSGTDFVKVVDFGISKSVRPEEGGDSPRLTQTGMVLGTPLYMSPEQARGDEELDHRIDVYAVGVLLYEMITGEVPFRGSNYLNILSQVISDEPPPPSSLRPELDRDLESIILKSMAKEVDERYQSMAELDADLEALEEEGGGKTTGARITAARWRKRRERRSPLQIASWTAALAVVAAGIAFSLSAMLGEDDRETIAAAPVQPAPTPAPTREPDAAPPPAPAPPDPELSTIRIISEPEGARIYHGSRFIGVAPVEHSFEKKSREIILRAELDGYQSGTIPVNPFTDHEAPVTVTLKPVPEARKPSAKKQPKKRPPEKNADDGAESGRDETGDLMQNPHRR